MIQEVRFPTPIPQMFQEDLERHMFYISERIERFELMPGPAGIEGVWIDLDPDRDGAQDIEQKILAASGLYTARLPRRPPTRVWSNPTACAFDDSTFAEMTRRGIAFQAGPGLVALGEEFMAVMDAMDASITRLVKTRFNAREYRYPTLIPAEIMQRGGYLRSFPQLIMFAARLHSDYAVYTAAMQEDALDAYLQHMQPSGLCLPPTMCYHTYSQLSDSTLTAKPGRVITAKGKSFRFESKYEKNLERLWDFTIREIVFLGDQGFSWAERSRFMKETFQLIESWGLGGYCETASDAFFVDSSENDTAFTQRLMALKYELRLNIRPASTIACASFNLHNDFFGNTYNIRHPDGQPVRTACAGFGLERLAFAFFSQHGLDREAWPASVREALQYQ